MKYSIDTTYDAQRAAHAFRGVPAAVGGIGQFTSDAVYGSSTDAWIAGVRYLEVMGVKNINWQTVASQFV